MINAIVDDNKKLINNSYKVTPIWIKILLFTTIEKIVFNTFEGEENKNSIKIQNEMQLVVDSFYIENIPNYYEFAPVINLKFDSLTYNYNIMKYIIQKK